MSDVVDVSEFFKNGINTMRMTPGDVDPRVSIIDFVMAMTGKSMKRTREMISNLEINYTGFFLSINQYQFSGRGQREQYVLTAKQAIELLMMLPGNSAKAFRRHCTGLLTRLFAGDPALHDLLDQYNLVGDAAQNLGQYLADAAPEIMAAAALEDKDDTHDVCKEWIAANLGSISFATEICPACKTPVVGLSLSGGVAFLEQIIPHTAYRADVLVQLPANNTSVAIEVAHTHFTSMKRAFECEEMGTTTCEVETCEIQSAMQRHSHDSFHILRTTRTRSVRCAACAVE
jgi:hypothetical protein